MPAQVLVCKLCWPYRDKVKHRKATCLVAQALLLELLVAAGVAFLAARRLLNLAASSCWRSWGCAGPLPLPRALPYITHSAHVIVFKPVCMCVRVIFEKNHSAIRTRSPTELESCVFALKKWDEHASMNCLRTSCVYSFISLSPIASWLQ